MSKLMNCPRCGNKPTVKKNELFGGYVVVCYNCKWANEGGDRQDAIDQWNEAHGGEDADNDK